MKRSQMISKIASVILNFNEPFKSYVDRKKALEIAEVILQVQEKEGILPPKACIEHLIRVGEEERVTYRNEHEWEPEDE